MKAASIVSTAFAALFGASLALSAHAATSNNPDMTKNLPSSVNESAPDKAGMKAKGTAGANTMPGKGPSSVSESAPAKTGKDTRAPLVNDSPNMPNPKMPSSVSESKPSQPHK